MKLVEQLVAALGPDRVAVPEAPWTDVCRFEIGRPLAVVTPGSTAEAADAVRLAAEAGCAVVAAGERTAYWRPLHVEGAVVLSTRALRGVSIGEETVHVGAGEPVRTLDVALRQAGAHLPLVPDAYGETSVGAMVATGCTSGIGMGRGSIARWLTGLTVVTGTGAVVRVGAATAFDGNTAFMAEGVPHGLSAFVGAEGTLGIVTEVTLRKAPLPWRVRVSCEVDDPWSLLPLAREAGLRELYDTFRIRREVDRNRGLTIETTPWKLDCFVFSALSAQEAAARADWVADQILQRTGVRPSVSPESDACRLGQAPDYDQRWEGPIGVHREMASRALLVGLDVNASYASSEALRALADEVAREQVAEGAPMVRTALYLAPTFVNLGMHTAFAPTPETVARAHDRQQHWLGELAKHEVVPYRLGRIWPHAMSMRLTGSSRSWLAALKQHFDPRGILQPGHLLHGREEAAP